jgi:hypothetical protein
LALHMRRGNIRVGAQSMNIDDARTIAAHHIIARFLSGLDRLATVQKPRLVLAAIVAKKTVAPVQHERIASAALGRGTRRRRSVNRHKEPAFAPSSALTTHCSQYTLASISVLLFSVLQCNHGRPSHRRGRWPYVSCSFVPQLARQRH